MFSCYKIIILSICLSLVCLSAKAQLSGAVNYEHLGISLQLPPGWQGQEMEEGILLGSNEMAGFIIVSTHSYTQTGTLRNEMSQDMPPADGTQDSLVGEVEPLGSNGYFTRFAGTFQYEPAKACIAASVNPKGGLGVMVTAITSSTAYSDAHEQIVKDLLASVRYSAVKESSEVGEWRSYFQNVRLTYMDSYYSSSGGMGGGYSTEIKIDLCAAGFFNYYSADDMSVGGDYSSAYSSGRDQGAGTWQVTGTADGGSMLVLRFYNDEVYEYRLTYEDEKVHLNGNRYFVTSEGEYAPNCR